MTGPPGWYPDPWDGRRHRWWDGAAWSWQVSTGDVVEWDPLPDAGPDRPGAPGVRGVGLALAGFAAGVALSLGAAGVLWALGRPGGVVTRLVVVEAALWAGLLAACVIVSRRRGTGRLSRDFDLRARPVDLAIGLAGSLVGRIVSVVAVIPFSALLLDHAQRTPEQRTLGYFARGEWGWAALVLVTCVGAPVVEELFFRGLIQTRLVARWGPVAGIGVSSALFGAAHLIGWVGPISLLYAWSVAGAGLVLGTVRHLTGRLGTSMAAHGLFNAQALAILALAGAVGH